MSDNTERSAGFYWVKFGGQWIPARYSPRNYDGEPNGYPWEIVASDYIFEECEFDEVGPAIHPPDDAAKGKA